MGNKSYTEDRNNVAEAKLEKQTERLEKGPATETEEGNSPSYVLNGTELFSKFTADIIKEDVPFTR